MSLINGNNASNSTGPGQLRFGKLRKYMVGRAEERKIGSIIFGHLMILVFLAFVLAALAGYFVQNYFQERQSFILLREYIEDFAADWDFNETMKKYITEGWGIIRM